MVQEIVKNSYAYSDKKDGDYKDRYDLNDGTEFVSLRINPMGGNDVYRMW